MKRGWMFLLAGLALLAPLGNIWAAGVTFLAALDTNQLSSVQRQAARENYREVMLKRFSKLGFIGQVTFQGSDQMLVQVVGFKEGDLENVRRVVQSTAYLEFRMVHPKSEELLAQGSPIEPGYEIKREQRKNPDGTAVTTQLLVEKKPRMTGKYLKRVLVTRDPFTSDPQINFELSNEGTKLFRELTRNNVGQRLAIILEGELYSAPFIRSEIPNGRGMISGNFQRKEAVTLATLLENPLETSVRILEERNLDPETEKAMLTRHRTRLALRYLLLVSISVGIAGLGFLVLLLIARRRRVRRGQA